MVRDDFWMAATRFFERPGNPSWSFEAELRSPSISSILATPAECSAAFGTAYGDLPERRTIFPGTRTLSWIKPSRA